MTIQKAIDINADVGESYGVYQIGNDADIFPLVSSCNIACGFHAGDPYHIEKTIDLAILNQVKIGAHPSYPDLNGFGRRFIKMDPRHLSSTIKYQVSALMGLTESKGARLSHVKPHGALYHQVSKDREEAIILARAVTELSRDLFVVGPPDSIICEICRELGVPFLTEGFADRRYLSSGLLKSRDLTDSVLQNPENVARQVIDIVTHQRVLTEKGSYISIEADTICVHGDHAGVKDNLSAIHRQLGAAGWKVKRTLKV